MFKHTYTQWGSGNKPEVLSFATFSGCSIFNTDLTDTYLRLYSQDSDNSLVLNLVICKRSLILSLVLLNLGILIYVHASITSCSYCLLLLPALTISKWCEKYWEVPLRGSTSLMSGSNIKAWLWEKITDLYAGHYMYMGTGHRVSEYLVRTPVRWGEKSVRSVFWPVQRTVQNPDRSEGRLILEN